MEVAISVLGTSVGATQWDPTMCPGIVAGLFPRRRAQAMHMETVHAHRCKHHWCIPEYLDVLHTDVLTDLGGQWRQWLAQPPVTISKFIAAPVFPRMACAKMAVEIADATHREMLMWRWRSGAR